MADIKEFEVKRVMRSDGADSGPGYWPAPAPSTAKKGGKDAAAGATGATRQKAHMVRLDESDPRFIDWRMKLGILLKQELAPNPDGTAATREPLQPRPAACRLPVRRADVLSRRPLVVPPFPAGILAV